MAEKKKRGFARAMSSIGKYFRDTWNEAKKVTWLSWAQTWKNVAIVLATVLIFAVVIWGLDFVLTEARDLMISAFSK